jgi:hypothetical protein
MSRSDIFDYLLLLFAPVITYLFSKVEIFAPRSQSTYMVVHDMKNQHADLLASTKYLEIYADRNLAAAFLIILSILLILHLLYFIYAFRQPQIPFKLLWKVELDADANLNDAGTLASSRTTWYDVINIPQNQPPEHRIYSSSLTRSASAEPDTSEQEDIDLKELSVPRFAQVRDTVLPQFQHGTYEQRHRRKEDDDWKTVYCKGWEEGSDRESVTDLRAEVHAR